MIGGRWVLDGSLALALALPDESSAIADEFWPAISDEHLVWVPALFWYEIANGLSMARRRGRISEAVCLQLTELFTRLPLRTDAMVGGPALSHHVTLATRYGLSAYDAAYLELSCRRGLGLATLDERLAQAAEEAGVEVWPEGPRGK
jgi:predicted nucleic acid-binding protein